MSKQLKHQQKNQKPHENTTLAYKEGIKREAGKKRDATHRKRIVNMQK